VKRKRRTVRRRAVIPRPLRPRTPAPARWRLYLRLGRVSNLPTVWTNVLAGLLLAGAAPTPPLLLPLLAALTLFYTGGMFLNDAFDHAHDKRLRPERPIPAGHIGVAEVHGAGFAQLAIGMALLALPYALGAAPHLLAPLVGGLTLGALIVYYNARHKQDPLSPLVMALCRAAVYASAALAVTGAIPAPVRWGIAVMLGYLIGLTYVAKQENLRAVKNLWPLAFLAAPFLYGAWGVADAPGSAIVLLAFLAWVLYALSFALRRKGRDIPRTVVSLIAGISLLDALLIAQATGSAAWTLLAGAAFLLTLYFQRYIAGT
jgi:4-hydroxybenzoate polyprenyltransferase